MGESLGEDSELMLPVLLLFLSMLSLVLLSLLLFSSCRLCYCSGGFVGGDFLHAAVGSTVADMDVKHCLRRQIAEVRHCYRCKDSEKKDFLPKSRDTFPSRSLFA